MQSVIGSTDQNINEIAILVDYNLYILVTAQRTADTINLYVYVLWKYIQSYKLLSFYPSECPEQSNVIY